MKRLFYYYIWCFSSIYGKILQEDIQIYINNLQVLPYSFFNTYKYIINFYNNIPEDILNEYKFINKKLLEIMIKKGYKLLINQININDSKDFEIIITKEKISNIYHNNIKKYILITIPTEENLLDHHHYQSFNSYNQQSKKVIFFHNKNQFIMSTALPIKFITLINHSDLIKFNLLIKQKNNIFFIIIEQKKLWFIKNIQWKYKNNQYYFKIYYSSKLKVNYQSTSNQSIHWPNIFYENNDFILLPSLGYNNQSLNPQYLFYNFILNPLEKNNLITYEDFPTINYFIKYFYHKNNNEYELLDQPSDEKINYFINEKLLHMYNKNIIIKNSNNLNKKINLFSIFPIYILYGLNNYSNNNLFYYMQMVLAFIYQKPKEFKKNFFLYNNNSCIYLYLPLLMSFKTMNEHLFWLIIFLLPYHKIDKTTIESVIRYSYKFPNGIKEKIHSFVIYHLYLNNQDFIINKLFVQNLIDINLDMQTNYIYIKTKHYNGVFPGKNLFPINYKINLIEANIIIEKFLLQNYFFNNKIQIKTLLHNLQQILTLHKNYKIIISKNNETKLFALLMYLGKYNYNGLLQILINSYINIESLINYIKINNPKYFEKYYKNLK